jgi:hypothetical protein
MLSNFQLCTKIINTLIKIMWDNDANNNEIIIYEFFIKNILWYLRRVTDKWW